MWTILPYLIPLFLVPVLLIGWWAYAVRKGVPFFAIGAVLTLAPWAIGTVLDDIEKKSIPYECRTGAAHGFGCGSGVAGFFGAGASVLGAVVFAGLCLISLTRLRHARADDRVR